MLLSLKTDVIVHVQPSRSSLTPYYPSRVVHSSSAIHISENLGMSFVLTSWLSLAESGAKAEKQSL